MNYVTKHKFNQSRHSFSIHQLQQYVCLLTYKGNGWRIYICILLSTAIHIMQYNSKLALLQLRTTGCHRLLYYVSSQLHDIHICYLNDHTKIYSTISPGIVFFTHAQIHFYFLIALTVFFEIQQSCLFKLLLVIILIQNIQLLLLADSSLSYYILCRHVSTKQVNEAQDGTTLVLCQRLFYYQYIATRLSFMLCKFICTKVGVVNYSIHSLTATSPVSMSL